MAASKVASFSQNVFQIRADGAHARLSKDNNCGATWSTPNFQRRVLQPPQATPGLPLESSLFGSSSLHLCSAKSTAFLVSCTIGFRSALGDGLHHFWRYSSTIRYRLRAGLESFDEIWSGLTVFSKCGNGAAINPVCVLQGSSFLRLQKCQGRPGPGSRRGGALSTQAAVFDQLSISLENAWKKLANEGGFVAAGPVNNAVP